MKLIGTILIIIVLSGLAVGCIFEIKSMFALEVKPDITPLTQVIDAISEKEIEDAQKGYTEIEATITAYTSSVAETDSEPCISASGVNICGRYIAELVDDNGEPTMTIPIYKGFGIIACPKEYEFEKDIIEINSVWLKCLDRMSSKYPDRFDIYFGQGAEAKQRAREWGIQTKIIKIYE